MSRAQRLSFLAIAAVIAVVALVALGGGGGGEDMPSPTAQATPETTTTAEPEPDGTATLTATATPEPEPPVPVVDAGAAEPRTLRFSEGETVRFRVRADAADEIHVHGYDIERPVAPGRATTFSFPADITGIFEIELHGSGKVIAQLRVDPD